MWLIGEFQFFFCLPVAAWPFSGWYVAHFRENPESSLFGSVMKWWDVFFQGKNYNYKQLIFIHQGKCALRCLEGIKEWVFPWKFRTIHHAFFIVTSRRYSPWLGVWLKECEYMVLLRKFVKKQSYNCDEGRFVSHNSATCSSGEAVCLMFATKKIKINLISLCSGKWNVIFWLKHSMLLVIASMYIWALKPDYWGRLFTPS